MNDTDATPNDPTHCDKCRRPHTTSKGHPSCRGHKRDGSPCTAPRMTGQLICRMHGGASPQAKAAALVRIQHAEALTAVHTLGIRSDVSPSDALLEEVQWTAGHVHWLRAKLREEHPDIGSPSSLVFGTTLLREKTGGEDWGKTVEAKAGASAWYQMYLDERKHLVTVCSAALKAGVEERRVNLELRQGELLAQAVRGILADLNLTSEQQVLVGEIVPKHLRLVAGGGA